MEISSRTSLIKRLLRIKKLAALRSSTFATHDPEIAIALALAIYYRVFDLILSVRFEPLETTETHTLFLS